MRTGVAVRATRRTPNSLATAAWVAEIDRPRISKPNPAPTPTDPAGVVRAHEPTVARAKKRERKSAPQMHRLA